MNIDIVIDPKLHNISREASCYGFFQYLNILYLNMFNQKSSAQTDIFTLWEAQKCSAF